MPMLCLDDEIDIALKADAVLTGLLGGQAIYEHDESLLEDIPDKRVIYEEIGNVPAMGADDAEKISRITYRVSVCSDTQLKEIIDAVERVMISIGFNRHSIDKISGLPLGVKGQIILFITVRECV